MSSERNEIESPFSSSLTKNLCEQDRLIKKSELGKCSEIKKESKEYPGLDNTLHLGSVIDPPPYLYDKIRKNIDIEQNKGILGDIRILIRRSYRNTALLWALAVAQVVMIMLLVWNFRLPASKVLTAQPRDNRLYINIVFKESIQEKALRELLNNVNASIVQGPTKKGLYLVRLRGSGDIEATMKILEESGKVRFVAKPYR